MEEVGESTNRAAAGPPSLVVKEAEETIRRALGDKALGLWLSHPHHCEDLAVCSHRQHTNARHHSRTGSPHRKKPGKYPLFHKNVTMSFNLPKNIYAPTGVILMDFKIW